MKDRILIWISSNLLYYGIAKSLQEQYDCELFAIIDVTDKPKQFFQQQQMVDFKKTWFYHDYISKTTESPDLEYLASLEEKYKINLWLDAYNERIFYEYNDYYKFNSDEVLLILEQECKLFEKILDEVKPDFVIMDQPWLHHNHLFYKICKAKNIKLLLLKATRIGYKCTISNDEESIAYVKNSSKNEKSRTFEELQNYLNEFNIYKMGVEGGRRFINSKRELIKAAIKFLFSDSTNKKTHYTYYGRTKARVLIKSILYSLKTKYRKIFLDKNSIYKINDTTPFIYFPLQFTQEQSSLILAPFYTNQLEVIRHIVKSLPIGYRLYVKENPLMYLRGWRKISEYKQIMNLPNVKLIHYSIKPTEIINKCSIVISISGTATFEAAFYKKPSIIFADTSFSMLPSIHRIKTLEELPEAIRSSLKKEVRASDLNEYVNFIDKISFTFDYTGMMQDIQDYFHYGGFLIDVDIPIQKMQSFLEKHNSTFQKLASKFIEKIKQQKESELGSNLDK